MKFLHITDEQVFKGVQNFIQFDIRELRTERIKSLLQNWKYLAFLKNTEFSSEFIRYPIPKKCLQSLRKPIDL